MMPNEQIEYTLRERTGIGQYQIVLVYRLECASWFLIRRCLAGEEVDAREVNDDVARTLLSSRLQPEFVLSSASSASSASSRCRQEGRDVDQSEDKVAE